ncbi:hypothetical protein GF327_04575 [Candidatus Woesearchaeota archaeon]|nr:hypothetical protein [Candidatus Woesearchaeota archaeon]
MTIYSHSRLSTFEQCPLKFKYKYIDQIETEIETSIEAFMGKLVHDALEKLYKDLNFEQFNSLKDLFEFYEKEWKERFNDKILIVRKEYSEKNYKEMGKKFIKTYYDLHKPFNHSKTIDTEKRIVINLDKNNKYRLQGYIDRLACKGNVYEIHDYKTSSTLPLQEYADKDRQLALYSIAVKKGYKDAEKIKLIWHYLAFGKTIVSERNDKELKKLEEDTIKLIDEIESCTEFNPKSSALCSWCEYKPICPNWKHQEITGQLSLEEYQKENGVELADKYVELSQKKKKIEDEMELIKQRIFKYCSKNDLEVIFGTDSRLFCKTYHNLKFPNKNDPLRTVLKSTLKKIGKFEEVAEVDVFKLSRILQSKKWDEKTKEILKNFSTEDTVQRIYVGKKYR